MIKFDSFGSALNSVSELGQTASSYASKISSIVSGLSGSDSTAAHIRDVYTNGFLSDSTVYRPSKFARAFDEPTYLTFRIEFNFFDPVRNTAFNNNDVEWGGVYYGTMFDYMPEPFLQDYGNVSSIYGSDASTYAEATYGTEDKSMGKSYSTEAYLRKNLGDAGRAELLRNFKKGLRDIQDNYPYYFNKISGLSTLSKIDPATGIRVKDGKIEIECYEALDLRITQLLQMYRKIVWDDTYQRWVLPDMMRYFSMRIYISEIRLFHTVKGTLNSKKYNLYDFTEGDTRNATTLPGQTWYDKAANITNNILGSSSVLSSQFLGTNSTITNVLNSATAVADTAQSLYGSLNTSFTKVCTNAINTVMPTIMIDCHMCEFDISDTMSYIDSLMSSTYGNNAVAPKLYIKVGQATEVQSYPMNEWLYPKDNKYNLYLLQDANNTIADDAFNKYNDGTNDSDRLTNFESNIDRIIKNYIGTESFLVKKYNQNGNSKIDISNLTYTKNQTSTVQSITNLVTSALSTLNHYGVIGEHSTAVNVDPNKLQAVVAASAVLQELANAVNENSNIKSAAVQAVERESIAANVYASVLDDIISNSVNNEELRNVAIAVREGLNDAYSTELSSVSIQNLTELKNAATIGFKDYIYDASVMMNGDKSLEELGYWQTPDGKWTNISASQNDSNIQSSLETVGKAHTDNYVDPLVSEAVEDMQTIKDSTKTAFAMLNRSNIHSSAVENQETLKDIDDIYEEPELRSQSVEDLDVLKANATDTYEIPYDPFSVAVQNDVTGEDIYEEPENLSTAVEDMEPLKDNTSDIYPDGTLFSESVQDLDSLKDNAADIYEIPYDPHSTAVEDMEVLKNNTDDIYTENDMISMSVQDLESLKSNTDDVYDEREQVSKSVEDLESIKNNASDTYPLPYDPFSAAVQDMEPLKDNTSDVYDESEVYSAAVQDMEPIKDNVSDTYEIPYDPLSVAVQDMEQIKDNTSDVYTIPYDPMSSAVQDMEPLKNNASDIYETPYDPLSTAVQDMEPLKNNVGDIYEDDNMVSAAVEDMEPLKDNVSDIYTIPYDPHSTAVEDMEHIKNNASDAYPLPFNPLSAAVQDMEPLKDNAADTYEIPYDPLSAAVQDMESIKGNAGDIYKIPYDPHSVAVQDMESIKDNASDIYEDSTLISQSVQDMEQLKDNASDIYEDSELFSQSVQDLESMKDGTADIYEEQSIISQSVEDLESIKNSADDIYVESDMISNAVQDMESLKSGAVSLFDASALISKSVEDLEQMKDGAADIYTDSELISQSVEDSETIKSGQSKFYADASLSYSAAQAINHTVAVEDTIYSENNQTRVSRYGRLNKI